MDAPQEKTEARSAGIRVGPQPPPAGLSARSQKDRRRALDERAAS